MAVPPEEAEELVDCACCTLLIQRQVHIKCGECPVFLCIQCFRMGAEVGKHKRGHNYELIDTVGKATFDVRGSWGCMEEANLLVAAHRFKLGNWGEIVNLMKSGRTPHEASEYFDRFFIRGPLGQYGLSLAQWHQTRRNLLNEGTIRDLVNPECERFERWHLMLEALDAEKDLPSIDAPDFDKNLSQIMDNYVDTILNHDLMELDIRKSPKKRVNSYLSDVDAMDPSSDEDLPSSSQNKKARDSAALPSTSSGSRHLREEENGLEAETSLDASNLDPSNSIPVLVLKKVEKTQKGNYKFGTPAASRSCDRENGHVLRTSKDTLDKKRCSASEKTKRYRRVIKENSSGEEDNDDEMRSDSEDAKCKDGSRAPSEMDNFHGLEKEHSSDPDSSSESEVVSSKGCSTSKAKTGSTVAKSATRKKRKCMWKSKKMRRLEAFERRMASKGRKREEQLNQLDKIIPKAMIKDLRSEGARLCMDHARPREERPKLRQDDLTLLGYNADRDEFEMESFNEAETLISRLNITLPDVNDKAINVENHIKFARVQNYERTLAARAARRNAIMEHEKIPEFFEFMKTMTLEKRPASAILDDRTPQEKILARCQQTLTKDELQKLTDHHERFETLKERITKLRELQMKGVTSLKGFEKEIASTKKPKRTKPSAENKRKAGLRWKAIQRWHQKQYSNGQ